MSMARSQAITSKKKGEFFEILRKIK